MLEAARLKCTTLANEAGENLMTAEQHTAFDAAIAERDGLVAQIKKFEALQEV